MPGYKNIRELLSARENIDYRLNSHVVTAMGRNVGTDFSIMAFNPGPQATKRSGFIWGEAVWGVTDISTDSSPLASEYGISA